MRRLAFFLMYYVLLVISVTAGFLYSPSVAEPAFHGWVPSLNVLPSLILLPLAMVAGLRISNLPFVSRTKSRTDQVIQIAVGLLLGIFSFQLLRALATAVLVDRYVHLIAFVSGFCLVFASRLASRAINGHYARRILIFGSKASFTRFQHAHLQRGENDYILVGYYDPTPIQVEPELEPAAVNFKHGGLFEYCVLQSIDDVVVEFGEGICPEVSQSLMFCTSQGINVMETTAFFEKYLECVHEASLDERWFWGFDPAHLHPFYSAFKRCLDIGVSLVGIVAFLPLAPFVALAIKLQDGGPVLYSQTRTGLHNRTFKILKFRTMRVDAENSGAQWAADKDARITWLGTFLRRSRIDEVPQFWNILLGDMSFVGPRPERPEMIERIEKDIKFYKFRHLIKPGLTGWAQINYPYGASVEDAQRKLSYDFYYLKYASPFLDIMIIMRTFVAMARGAR